MKIIQTGIFNRRTKKLHPSEKAALDTAIKAIVNDLSIGANKRGDLAGVQVHKYKHENQQYLIAYKVCNEQAMLTLLAFGTHENFYRDLKR